MIALCNSNSGQTLNRELQHFFDDGDPIRLMELLMELKDLGTMQGVIDDHDRTELTRLHYLLAAIIRQKLQFVTT